MTIIQKKKRPALLRHGKWFAVKQTMAVLYVMYSCFLIHGISRKESWCVVFYILFIHRGNRFTSVIPVTGHWEVESLVVFGEKETGKEKKSFLRK